jgi:opacity protein-like surface antigen
MLLALPGFAQRHELGLLLGGFKPASRTLKVTPPARADFDAGMTLYANYGVRIAGTGESAAALYFEIPFLATPQHKITSASQLITRDVATLYLTPGFRLKFAPGARVAPYIAGGAGYGLFEHSTLRADGNPNGAPRTLGRAAFQFGGGVDVHVWKWVSLRGEFREFISGSPNLNVPVDGSIQHNVLFAGGFSLRF